MMRTIIFFMLLPALFCSVLIYVIYYGVEHRIPVIDSSSAWHSVINTYTNKDSTDTTVTTEYGVIHNDVPDAKYYSPWDNAIEDSNLVNVFYKEDVDKYLDENGAERNGGSMRLVGGDNGETIDIPYLCKICGKLSHYYFKDETGTVYYKIDGVQYFKSYCYNKPPEHNHICDLCEELIRTKLVERYLDSKDKPDSTAELIRNFMNED